MTDSLVHLRVPASLKRRWVRLSRADNMRLTDWIIEAVEQQMQQRLMQLKVPEDISFSDLNLARDPDGNVSFDMSVIERLCESSNVPLELITESPEDNAARLIVAWYHAHLDQGGNRDPVADDLIAEAKAEDAAGQHYSHAPGRA